MTITYDKFFYPTVLSSTVATLLTIPATSATTLLRGARIRFTNTASIPLTVTAYAVPPSGAASAANVFAYAKSVPINDYIDIDVPIMPAGALLQALCSVGSGVTAHMISGSYFT